MKQRDRGPVGQQGMSRNYTAYDPNAELDRRTFRIVWAVEAFVTAGFTALVVLTASHHNAPALIGPSLLLVWLPANIWLRDSARRRAYPCRATRWAAVVAVCVFAVGYVLFVLIALDVIDLRITSTPILILLGIVTYAVTIAALVLAYRARFFHRRVS